MLDIMVVTVRRNVTANEAVVIALMEHVTVLLDGPAMTAVRVCLINYTAH